MVRQQVRSLPKRHRRSVHFSPLTDWFVGEGGGGAWWMIQDEGWFRRDPFPVFSAGGPCEQFWHKQGCPLSDVVHLTLTMASLTVQGALKDCFAKAVIAWHTRTMQVSISWQLPEADLVPHPVIGLVLQLGDAEKFPQVLAFKSLDLCLEGKAAG